MRRQRVSRRASVSRFFGDAGRLRPSQLLASTAIVAAGMIAGGVSLPSLAVATPVCSSGDAFVCNGTGSTITSAETVSAGGDFSVSIGPGTPWTQHVTAAGTTAFTINANGNNTNEDGIHMYAGSSIFADPETGIGLDIENPGSNVQAIIEGASGEAGAASITGTTGIYISGGESGPTGHVHLANFGHVRGTSTYGIEANGASEDGLIFDLDNHSYGSAIGATDGTYVHDVQSTQINNGNGLIAGLNGNGVRIESVDNNDSSRRAVQINNNSVGIIAGTGNGISVANVGNGADGDIQISNGAGYSVNNSVLTANSGGLVVSAGNSGVNISSIDGHVGIDNSGTRGATVDPGTMNLDPLVYGGEGLLDGFAAEANLGGRLPLGIYGNGLGIYVSGASNGVDINNNAYVATTAWDEQLQDNVAIAPQLVGGGTIIGNGTGVAVFSVDGDVNVNNDNASQFVAGTIGTTGGLIAGFSEDGVLVSNVDGHVGVNNDGGTIYGGDNGVEVNSVGSEDGVDVNNAAGRIIGFNDVGVSVGESDNLDNVWRSSVNNWTKVDDASVPTYGGHIIGRDQGVMLAGNEVFVGNGPGGAILGQGAEGEDGYYATPIIDLHSSYHAGVDNYGLIATSDSDLALPHFDWYGEYALSYNGGVVEDPGYSLDTAAIAADVSQFGTFAWTGGQTGSLTRNNTSLADYGPAAQALAIRSSGETEDGYPYPGGGANVTNETSGILIGRVELGVGNEDGVSLQNFGTWYTQNIAGPYDEYGFAAGLYSEDGSAGIDNAGLVQTAFSAASREVASFFVPGGFNNGFYHSDGEVASPGLLSAIDGGVGDAIYIFNPSEDRAGTLFGVGESYYGGDFHGSTGGALTSFIGLDANLAPGTVEDPTTDDWSDPSLWRSDRFAAGYVDGSTGLIINKVNSSSTNLIGDTIILAHANFVDGTEDGSDPTCTTQTCKAGDTFYIAPQSKGYVDVGGVGAVQDGAYAWFLHAVGTAPDPDYIVVSDWSPADVQMPGLTTGAQNVWYDTSGVVADHIYGNHFPQAAEGGSGADLPVGVEPPPMVPATKPAVAVWGKFSGDHFNRTTSVVETLGGVTSTINTSLVQDTFSLLGGADFQPNGDADGIRAGAFAGVIGSGLHFSSYGASATYQGGTIGGYAAYTQDGFYVDAEAKVDVLNMTYTGGGLTANALSTSAGILANAGYRMQMGDAFIEPVASAAYVNTTIQNLALGGATVSFSNGQSFRLGAGAKVGTTVQVRDDLSAELALQGKIWDELGPANKITISDGFGNSSTFSDNISGLFGEISASATLYNDDKTMSGFVMVGDKFNGSFNNASIKGGIRKTF